MGSIANAKIVGYICRLCVQAHSTVIHLYSDRAAALQLVEKIQFHLDLDISPDDIRPKVICLACFDRIEETHRLWQAEGPAKDTEGTEDTKRTATIPPMRPRWPQTCLMPRAMTICPICACIYIYKTTFNFTLNLKSISIYSIHQYSSGSL